MNCHALAPATAFFSLGGGPRDWFAADRSSTLAAQRMPLRAGPGRDRHGRQAACFRATRHSNNKARAAPATAAGRHAPGSQESLP